MLRLYSKVTDTANNPMMDCNAEPEGLDHDSFEFILNCGHDFEKVILIFYSADLNSKISNCPSQP